MSPDQFTKGPSAALRFSEVIQQGDGWELDALSRNWLPGGSNQKFPVF